MGVSGMPQDMVMTIVYDCFTDVSQNMQRPCTKAQGKEELSDNKSVREVGSDKGDRQTASSINAARRPYCDEKTGDEKHERETLGEERHY